MSADKISVKVREDNILVEEIPSETKTVTGLHIVQPKIDEKKTMRANVISVGPDVEAVKVGDITISDVLAGSQWGEYIFMREHEVLAVEDGA